MLQRLALALDKAPEDVRGLHFLLGNGYGMDEQGRLRLLHTDDALLWTGYTIPGPSTPLSSPSPRIQGCSL